MAMKNIAGQPVRDNIFFDRPILSRQFQQKIESGSSILISAPRRVGKTSLMLHIHDHGMEGYYFIYLITESVNNEKEKIQQFVFSNATANCGKTLKLIKRYNKNRKKMIRHEYH
jgi:predicted AAA+ superfamily ATPase